MGLTEAINASTVGFTIISNAGKRYAPAELCGKMLGDHAAIFNECGMTEQERKGLWKIDES